MSAEFASEDKKGKIKRSIESADRDKEKQKEHPTHTSQEPGQTISALQNMIGNRAVQRMLAQRSGEGAFDLDDETEAKINRQRGGGQALEGGVQKQLESSMGVDFNDVNIHTSPDADSLNQQLGSKAFTTGNDIFFRDGQYDPNTTSGQELIAHEATHVVQQSSGAVETSGGMTVNAPGDIYEQEADSVAQSVMRAPLSEVDAVQKQEEDELQLQEEPEEEEAIQMQEEDELQMQAEPEEEEEEAIQMQEEDELQMQEEEEELIQPQEIPEDEMQMKRDQ